MDGFFHGDPHPGNIFVEPETGRIMFLDFGLVGLLTQHQRMDLLDLINGAPAEGHRRRVARALRA